MPEDDEGVMGEASEPSRTGAGHSGQGAERRSSPRFPCNLQPSWHDTGAGPQPELMKVHNISSVGIGLLVSEPVKPGTVLMIQLQSGDRPRSRPLPVRVMHGGHFPSCSGERLRAMITDWLREHEA